MRKNIAIIAASILLQPAFSTAKTKAEAPKPKSACIVYITDYKGEHVINMRRIQKIGRTDSRTISIQFFNGHYTFEYYSDTESSSAFLNLRNGFNECLYSKQ